MAKGSTGTATNSIIYMKKANRIPCDCEHCKRNNRRIGISHCTYYDIISPNRKTCARYLGPNPVANKKKKTVAKKTQYKKSHNETPIKHSLIKEDERIYLNIPYNERFVAREYKCKWDAEKKLWFAGFLNSNLKLLVQAYGVNDATSEKARLLLKEKLGISTEDKNT